MSAALPGADRALRGAGQGKRMGRRMHRGLCLLIGVALVVPALPAEAGRGRIICESRNRNFNQCRVRTDNHVRLVRQLSRDECRRNRSWGFDRDRIWVDRGCRAEFEFGRDNRSSGRNDAAIAAGVIGAIAIGAAIGSASNNNTQPPRYPPPPPPPAPVRGTLAVPSWAIGSFQAWDPEAFQTVQLVIQQNGRALLRDEWGQTINWGDVRDGFIFWSHGERSWIAREGNGVQVGDVGSSRNFMFHRA